MYRRNPYVTDGSRRDFNKDAATWDDNPMRIELARALADAIVTCIPVSGDMEVLDYGAGTGLVTLGLQPYAGSILAADSSQGMLGKLSEKITASGFANVRTILLDLERDPLPEGRFDLIVSTMTVHHIQDVPDLIGSFFRMLRPGGHIAIADLDLDGGEFHPDPTGVKHNGFDRDEIKRILAATGFLDVTVETAHTLKREVPDKGEREFSVFLAAGRKG